MKLHYQTLGNPKAPALLFLHGFLGLGTDWQEIAEAFAADHYCILPDLPGHGLSKLASPDTQPSMKAAADSLMELADDLRVDRVTIIGYSMGGRIALYFSLKFTDRVRAVVLESVNPGIPDARERQERADQDDQLALLLERDGLAKFLDDWYKAPLFASLQRDPGRLATLKQTRTGHDPRSIALSFRGLSVGRQPSLWDELDSLPMPVLVVAGALDEKYSQIAEETVRHLRHGSREIIAEAGHNVHFERPQEFLARLRDFFNDISA